MPLVGDTTIWSPMNSDIIKKAAATRLACTDHAEKKKRELKEKHCKARRWEFMPFAFNTLGGMGKLGYQFFQEAFNWRSKQEDLTTKERLAITYERSNLFAEMSVAIKRGNFEMTKFNATETAGGVQPAAQVDDRQDEL